ncbi:MAG TPA: DUF4097 family beta strand repeat-containing protein, partial [Candidatus Polarisedimenticolia bacterium]|nr:DUF4097 family beta strand repeat-containing protein [Candidatus Polarisedimenticolia bacterium]
DLDAMAISVAKGGARVLFKGQLLEPDPELSAEFELTVPRDLQEIDVATGAGDVDLRGLAGRASITTRGGVVIGDDLGGPLSVATEGGDIRIGTVRSGVSLQSQGGSLRVVSVGGDLVARSAGGDVIIGAAGGQVRAETGGGNIRIDSAAGDVTAATGGGNIEIGQVRGRVASTTGGGSIRVASATAGARCETGAGMIDLRSIEGPVSARTSSGNIRARLTGAGVRSGESDLQSRQGDVTVLLSESLPLTIRAFADGAEEGSIRSDFPLRIGRDTGTGGRTAAVAEGTIGRGGSLLKIRAVGGSIVILKADKKHD